MTAGDTQRRWDAAGDPRRYSQGSGGRSHRPRDEAGKLRPSAAAPSSTAEISPHKRDTAAGADRMSPSLPHTIHTIHTPAIRGFGHYRRCEARGPRALPRHRRRLSCRQHGSQQLLVTPADCREAARGGRHETEQGQSHRGHKMEQVNLTGGMRGNRVNHTGGMRKANGAHHACNGASQQLSCPAASAETM